MGRLNTLAPDLRASLALLVGQHKRYGEIASMLRVEERAVHDRAHAALALLAPQQARALNSAQREQIGDYLLGQADAQQRSAALALLQSSPAAREWARTLAAELDPIASGSLPEIPSGQPDVGAAADDREGSRLVGAAGEPHEGAPPAADDDATDDDAQAPSAPSSRRGGAILLLGLAAVVVVAVALIIGLGGNSSPSGSAANASAPSTTGASTGTTTQTTTPTAPTTTGQAGKSAASGKGQGSGAKGGSASQPRLAATVALTPPDTSSKALGLVEIIAEGHEHAFILAAEHLPPTHGFHYAAWLYNTPTDAYYLGGGTSVGAGGTLKAAQGLPPNASHYASIILTEQHEERPTQPGPIVLNGALKLS
ncbi:MAG TPA: hypothetical protein VNV42_13125 [Solirubrobacteraceae bacterium]|nr:hypothetical protein [Solirubrobacteraceae bacterium]